MIYDDIKVTGALKIQVHGPDGKLKEEQEVPNLVVNTGKFYIAQRMIATGPNSVPTAMSHMAIGSGTTTPAVTQTALTTQLARVGLTGGTGSVANATTNQVVYTATFGAGVGTGAVTEAGIFNAATAGTMLARTTFPVVNKEAADSITITWTVSIN